MPLNGATRLWVARLSGGRAIRHTAQVARSGGTITALSASIDGPDQQEGATCRLRQPDCQRERLIGGPRAIERDQDALNMGDSFPPHAGSTAPQDIFQRSAVARAFQEIGPGLDELDERARAFSWVQERLLPDLIIEIDRGWSEPELLHTHDRRADVRDPKGHVMESTVWHPSEERVEEG